MYIMSQAEDSIINSDFVQRFCLQKTTDNTLILAIYGTETKPVTIGRYSDYHLAREELMNIYIDLYGDVNYHCMVLNSSNEKIHDARIRRKGKS